LVDLFRLEVGKQVVGVDCEAAVVSLLGRERACLDGAPDVDLARSSPFHRFLQAQNCHRDLPHRS
jgi:hypothetical protein